MSEWADPALNTMTVVACCVLAAAVLAVTAWIVVGGRRG